MKDSLATSVAGTIVLEDPMVESGAGTMLVEDSVVASRMGAFWPGWRQGRRGETLEIEG